MNHFRRVFVVDCLALALLFATALASAASALSEEEAADIAVDAYLFGYPLVTMDMTRRRVTNVVAAEAARAPMGQFAHFRQFPTAAYRDVPGANVDTLYSIAWFDVGREPYVLSLPSIGNRYVMMPMLSGWTDVFAAPGSRTTGSQAHTFLISGPGWKGKVPKGMQQLMSPTAIVWVLGRTYSDGAPADLEKVHALQDQYELVPLSGWGKPYKPRKPVVDPAFDMKTDTSALVNGMDGATYFRTLAALLKMNPPAQADAPMVARMARIGLVSGKDFDATKLDPTIAKAVQAAPKAALAKVMSYGQTAGERVNGWQIMTKAGSYGTDYLLRAYCNALGPGWNRAEDAVYPTSFADVNGQPYDGANKYVVHIGKGEAPPVKGFWSLTLYGADRFLVDNPINRYAVGSGTPLKQNADGSVDVYIQKDSPGDDKESNWLPAPAGRFGLFLRLYWPTETPPSIIDGSWRPPAVSKMQ